MKMPMIDQLERNPPAPETELRALISKMPFKPPPDYIEFLRKTNGAEGLLGAAYVVIWPTDQLFKLNEEYHVNEFAPHLFLFGSDGGGEAYAFDMRSTPVAIVSVPFVGFDQEIVLGHTFTEFMNRLAVAPP